MQQDHSKGAPFTACQGLEWGKVGRKSDQRKVVVFITWQCEVPCDNDRSVLYHDYSAGQIQQLRE